MNRWVHCLLEDARAAAEAARRRVDEDMQKAESKFGAVGTSRGAPRRRPLGFTLLRPRSVSAADLKCVRRFAFNDHVVAFSVQYSVLTCFLIDVASRVLLKT